MRACFLEDPASTPVRYHRITHHSGHTSCCRHVCIDFLDLNQAFAHQSVLANHSLIHIFVTKVDQDELGKLGVLYFNVPTEDWETSIDEIAKKHNYSSRDQVCWDVIV